VGTTRTVNSTLARQLLVAFLLVAVPGTLVLGGVTMYSLRSLGTVSHQLAEILLSLEGTREVNLALTQAERPLLDHLRRPDPAHRAAFERIVQGAELKLATCAASRCHGAASSTTDMVATITPAITQIREAGLIVFGDASDDRATTAAIENVRRAAAFGHEHLERMSSALLTRVGELGWRSHEVSRRATRLTGSLTVAVLVLAGVVALVSARRIAAPLHALVAVIRRVMAGDWSARVEVRARGEIGELASAFNAMTDEIRAARARDAQALAQAERLSSLGLLAAGVAHELNNPLTSIVMNANLMIEEVGARSPLADGLRRIDAEAGRCRRIVDDLRAFARRRDVRPSASDVPTVVEQAVWSARHEIEQRHLRVERDLDADLPTVVWDVDRMVQVFTNLVANAAQAMSSDGTLAIRGRRENGWVRLDVSDTGPGIAPEHRGKIFDPFFTTKRDGTGLGLSICHGIVMTHGGRIEIDTRTTAEAGARGRSGTTVSVWLPLRAETA